VTPRREVSPVRSQTRSPRGELPVLPLPQIDAAQVDCERAAGLARGVQRGRIPRVPPDALFREPLHHSPGPAHGRYARLPLQLRHRRVFLPGTHAPIAGAPRPAQLLQESPMLRRLVRWEEELASPALGQGVFRPELLRPPLEAAPRFSTDTTSRRQRESGSPVGSPSSG